MGGKALCWIVMAVAAMAASTAIAGGASQIPYENVKVVAFVKGTCTFRMMGPQAPFIPCTQSVMFATLKTGRSLFLFTKEDASFSMSGGQDRQPNLENYALSLDKLSFGRAGRGQEGPVEGECRVRMTRQGAFRHIQCDAYNRAIGLHFEFRLSNIRSMEHKSF